MFASDKYEQNIVRMEYWLNALNREKRLLLFSQNWSPPGHGWKRRKCKFIFFLLHIRLLRKASFLVILYPKSYSAVLELLLSWICSDFFSEYPTVSFFYIVRRLMKWILMFVVRIVPFIVSCVCVHCFYVVQVR